MTSEEKARIKYKRFLVNNLPEDETRAREEKSLLSHQQPAPAIQQSSKVETLPTVDLSVMKEDILSGVRELLLQHSQQRILSEPSTDHSKSDAISFSDIKEEILTGVKDLLSQHEPENSPQPEQNFTINEEIVKFMSDMRQALSNSQTKSDSSDVKVDANKCTDEKTRVTEEKFLKYKYIATLDAAIKTMHNFGNFDYHINELEKSKNSLSHLAKSFNGLKQKKISSTADVISKFEKEQEESLKDIKEACNSRKSIFITDFNSAVRDMPFDSDVIDICDKKECMGSSELISSTCNALIFKNTGDFA